MPLHSWKSSGTLHMPKASVALVSSCACQPSLPYSLCLLKVKLDTRAISNNLRNWSMNDTVSTQDHQKWNEWLYWPHVVTILGSGMPLLYPFSREIFTNLYSQNLLEETLDGCYKCEYGLVYTVGSGIILSLSHNAHPKTLFSIFPATSTTITWLLTLYFHLGLPSGYTICDWLQHVPQTLYFTTHSFHSLKYLASSLSGL